MEIADSVIERLFLSLIIPVVRPKCIKVLSHILCSAQSLNLFMKIVPRIPKVFATMTNFPNAPIIPPDVQLFIDLIYAFVKKYDINDLEIVSKVKSVFCLQQWRIENTTEFNEFYDL